MPLQHLNKIEARRFGIPKKSIQTILINKEISLKDCKQWLKSHGYLYQNYRLEGEHRRFQQTPPIIRAHYYSKKLNNEITFVFQNY